jgi:hypothetical protein
MTIQVQILTCNHKIMLRHEFKKHPLKTLWIPLAKGFCVIWQGVLDTTLRD